MADLLELAARCEAATGEDANMLAYLEMDICTALGIEPEGHERPFVTSLDAAMTLVPSGLGWLLSVSDVGCLVRTRGHGPIGFHDSLPALALCAAALRARTAK